MKGALIIAGLAFFTLLFVHMNWWDPILDCLGHQSIYLSLGFYLFSSTLLCIAWVITVFVIDHMSFWRFRPGQVTHEYLGGSSIRVMTPTTWSSRNGRTTSSVTGSSASGQATCSCKRWVVAERKRTWRMFCL